MITGVTEERDNLVCAFSDECLPVAEALHSIALFSAIAARSEVLLGIQASVDVLVMACHSSLTVFRILSIICSECSRRWNVRSAGALPSSFLFMTSVLDETETMRGQNENY